MNGLINQAMQEEPAQDAQAAPGEQESAEPNGDSEFDASTVRRDLKLPKDMEVAYDRIIKAGLKVMFDPSMREETMGFIEEAGGDPKKMAEGVTAVVVTLYQQSNGTLPPNLLIPAGIELLAHAADVANAGGMQVGKEAVAEAMSAVVQEILVKFGATPAQMQKLMSGMDSGQAAPAPSDAPAPQGV